MFRYLIWLLPLALSTPAIAADTPAKPPPPEPVTSAELEGAIRRGVEFLVKNQNADGSWGSAERTKDLNIMADAPGRTGHFRRGRAHSPLPP